MFKSFFKKIISSNREEGIEDWDLEEQARYIAYLMQWYSVKRSAYLANQIVKNLESYRARTNELDNEASVMKCDRLIQQWRYLAEHPSAASSMGY